MAFLFALALSFTTVEAHPIGDWQCEAEGWDRFNQRFVVKGEKQIVIWEAERSALEACSDRGYKNCRVQYCTDF